MRKKQEDKAPQNCDCADYEGDGGRSFGADLIFFEIFRGFDGGGVVQAV